MKSRRLRRAWPGSLYAGCRTEHLRESGDLSEEELESFNPTLDQNSSKWDVFDSEGRYLGVVELSDRFTPFIVKGDRCYGVHRDEIDVQYVQVLRINGVSAASSCGSVVGDRLGRGCRIVTIRWFRSSCVRSRDNRVTVRQEWG